MSASGEFRSRAATTTREAAGADAVRELLAVLGEDPERDGLQRTPERVVRALAELMAGRDVDVAKLLATTFEDSCDEMVVVTGIRVASLCEHHLLPFTGTAAVGYIPNGRVVGLSKLPRVVEAYARRLQLQERLTAQIADAIAEGLNAKGVGVVITAHHSCMGLRGVTQPQAAMTTSALRGAMRETAEARAEFLALARAGNGQVT